MKVIKDIQSSWIWTWVALGSVAIGGYFIYLAWRERKLHLIAMADRMKAEKDNKEAKSEFWGRKPVAKSTLRKTTMGDTCYFCTDSAGNSAPANNCGECGDYETCEKVPCGNTQTGTATL